MGIARQRDWVRSVSAEHGKEPLPRGGVTVPGIEVGGQPIRGKLLGLLDPRPGVFRELELSQLLGWDHRDIELAHEHLLPQHLPSGAAGFAALQCLL